MFGILLPHRRATESDIYATIPVQKWQTRLLRVQPGSEDLQGDLIVADITFLDGAVLHDRREHVEYYALSYTWGTDPDAHTMTLNGFAKPIRANLYEFLLLFRASLRAPAYIWIDALCINQADPVEKAFQVSSMLPFYQKAKQVIAWLGPAGPFTDSAMARIEVGYTGPWQYLTSAQREGLVDLLRRPWPRRIWVKQEVWAAKDIIVKCGKYEMSYSDLRAVAHNGPANFCGAWKALRRQPANFVHVAGGFQAEWRPVPDTVTSSGLERSDILTLLYESIDSQSTDLRDRVFALVGMSSDPPLEVSYLRSPSEVFLSLARGLIVRENLVIVVLGLVADFGSLNGLALPSWCPDWRTLGDPRQVSGAQFSPKARTLIAVGPEADKAWSALRFSPYSVPECSFRYDLDPFPTTEELNVIILRGLQMGKIPPEKSDSAWQPVTWDIFNPDNNGPGERLEKYVEWQKHAASRAEQMAGGYLSIRGAQNADEGGWITQPSLCDLFDYPETEQEKLQRPRAEVHKWGKRSFNAKTPASKKPGDVVIACLGSNVLLLLRKQHGDSAWTFVGPIRDASRDVMEDAATMLRFRQSLDALELFRVV